MTYRGDIRLGDTIDVKFSTVGTTGAPTTLAGTPVVSAYVGNSTTQITAGITLTVDFDGVTGLHNVRVVASSGNGFATATNVDLVITTGTVGGTSVVGYVVGSFSIENRSALMPTTAGRTAAVDASGQVTVGAFAANAITAAAIATGAITSTKFAAGAIDAASLATDAVDEIRDGVWGKTQAELTGDPGATPTVLQSLALPYMAIRNKRDTDSGLGTDEIHNSAGSVILTATISDAAGVFSKAKYA